MTTSKRLMAPERLRYQQKAITAIEADISFQGDLTI